MNDWTDKGMASSWTASAVGPAPQESGLDRGARARILRRRQQPPERQVRCGDQLPAGSGSGSMRFDEFGE